MEIICDNPTLRAEFDSLRNIIVQEGGWVNPGAQIIESAGDISVNFNPSKELRKYKSKPLFKVPQSCLPCINHFKLKQKNNNILIQKIAPQASKTQIFCMQSMLHIYNATNKIDSWRKSASQYSLKNDIDLNNHISKRNSEHINLSAKPNSKSIFKVIKEKINRTEKHALITNFIQSRMFNLTHKNGSFQKVLMPLIDNLNHHPKAKPFRSTYEDKGNPNFLFVDVSISSDKSDECYVKYSPFLDSFDFAILYGFFESETRRMVSIPTTLNLSNDFIIHIQRRKGQTKIVAKRELSKLVEPDLPYLIDRKSKSITLSQLILPSVDAPNNFRKIMDLIIRQIYPKASIETVKAHVLYVENEVLKTNIEYFEKLSQLTAQAKAIDRKQFDGRENTLNLLEDLSRCQLSLLNEYVDKMEILIS